MSNINSLEDLFVEQLRDLYDAEQQILRALPKMVREASSEELKQGFRDHIEQTRTQVDRLEEIFRDLGQSPEGPPCKGMEGLLQEGEKAFEIKGKPNVRDAALVVAAQKVEHYEVAGYGSVKSFAEQLGYDNAVDLLDETLDEEAETDSRLTKLAEGTFLETGINVKAQ
jgi:ferritin-like metal-binding protein YciE